MATHNYYTTLGIKRNASQADIKQAYRQLAKKYHPDVSEEANAETHFKKIVEAYDTLKNPEKRRHYDSLDATGNSPFAGFDPDIFGDLFKQTPTKKPSTQTSPNTATNQPSSQTIPFAIELEDVFYGASKTFTLSNGKTINVTIPQGIEEGKKIRLPQMADNGGDLLLAIHINPHKYFKQQGNDLHIEQTISAQDAQTGTTLQLDTLVETIAVTIPANTQSGDTIQLNGKGLPYTPTGQLIMTIQVEKPLPTSPRAKKTTQTARQATRQTKKKNKLPAAVQQQIHQLIDELESINEMLKQIENEHSPLAKYRFHTLLQELHQETCLLAKESNNPKAIQTAFELYDLIEAMQVTLRKLTPN